MRMTPPTLLRLTRWCAKWAGGFLLVATLFLIPGPVAQGRAPSDVAGGLPGRRTERLPLWHGTGGWSLLPGAVTDLRVSAVTDTTAVLTWTEVGTGTTAIARYAVRFGDLATYGWPNVADVTTGGCAAPIYGSTVGGGRTRTCVLGGLQPHRAYRFQIIAYTGVLNTTAVFGPLSNIVTAATAERLGPMLIVRPGMFLDTLAIAEASLPYDFGPRRFPLRGRFPAGDRVASFYDSSGALVAWGYLLLVKP